MRLREWPRSSLLHLSTFVHKTSRKSFCRTTDTYHNGKVWLLTRENTLKQLDLVASKAAGNGENIDDLEKDERHEESRYNPHEISYCRAQKV